MSMPKFPNPKDILSREEAINAIITSIAMEEMALSRILTAESEKITKALENIDFNCEKDRKMILSINQSVTQLVEKIVDLQFILKSKLHLAIEAMPHPRPWPPRHPCKCINIFCADSKYVWSPCRTLQLCHIKRCDDCVHTARIDGDFIIILPHSKRFDIDLTLRLTNRPQNLVTIELRQTIGKTTTFSKKYTSEGKQHISIHDNLTLFSEGAWDNHLSLRLLSQNPLEIAKACIEVKTRHPHNTKQPPA
ncbi:MAG: hypothetical protein FWC76_00570 [Defluviitaleaceae bacterium]|nr:hypothetical protein [Defluviitaleaceae bacterium]